jgi:solute carrier family 1 (glial high affinity glutamate transporter), member 2
MRRDEEEEEQRVKMVDISNKTWFQNFCDSFKDHILLILTFAGVILGVTLGFTLRAANLSSDTIMLISFPGDILMRMLKMLILPLIVSSIITGVAVLDPKSSGKIGLYAICYYFVTTIVAAILGIILVVAIKPGNEDTKKGVGEGTTTSTVTTQDAILDLIRNIFPENLMQATIQQGQTHYTFVDSPIIRNSTGNCKLLQLINFLFKRKKNFIILLFLLSIRHFA